MINKSILSCVSYFMKNTILAIMRILMKKKKVITLINRKKINIITIALMKKIKGFLKTKCKFNLEEEIIEKIFI